MLIEIRKVNFLNKGAELMLYAILQKMQTAYPNAKYAIAPRIDGTPYEKRAQLGLLQKAWLWRYNIQWGNIAVFVPKKIRDMYGIVTDKEIDVVLDASGFSYSDQWWVGCSLELADACKRWKRNGTKIVLLPQTFGPFSFSRTKKAIKTVVDTADIIFARDRLSYEHLIGIAGELPNIKIAPDFTNLVAGVLPDDFDAEANRFCIVPNYRMLDKTSKEQSKIYLKRMIACTQYLFEREQKPFILLHELDTDIKLAHEISDAVSGRLPVIVESDPVKLKGIIGACEGMIGSRFHALVGALSQNIPALGTGWSHKYKMLFDDYGFPEGLLDVIADEEEIRGKIDMVTKPESKKKIMAVLRTKSDSLRQMSEDMWALVFKVLEK